MNSQSSNKSLANRSSCYLNNVYIYLNNVQVIFCYHGQ